MKNWRVNLVLVVFLLFGATLVARLAYLQLIRNDYYKALARGQQNDFQTIEGERGEIFFNNGQILATNIKGKFVYISPGKFKENPALSQAADSLAKILNVEKSAILEKAEKNSLFESVKRRLSDEEIKLLSSAKILGVHLGDEIWRNYPQGTFASHLAGFLGGAGKGQYGIEGYYDSQLRGKEGIGRTKGNPLNYLFGSPNAEYFKGDDITLTLDYNVQFMAEKLLRDNKKELEYEGGQILVLEPISGKILALAEYPNFDPNNYSQTEGARIFQNSFVQKVFEPGSILKPITMASALNENRVSPQTLYEDTGSVVIKDRTINNFANKSYGRQTMTGVLEKSINTGAIFAEQKLGAGLFMQYLEKFGFFDPTQIDLQGEVYSQNSELKKGYEVGYATASFGQGIEITPLQMARAFSALANGGKLMRPYVVEKIANDDRVIENKPEVVSENVISQQTASQISAMLVSVIENGFSKKAKIPGYYIAGKTGTAQVAYSALGINKTGYSEKTVQSSIGYGPAFNPRFLVFVKLDNPRAATAEYSALPIFKEMTQYLINYLQIPPDYK